MVYVHPLQNVNTSRQSKNLTGDRINTKHSGRCFSQTSSLINWPHLMLILQSEGCWTSHVSRQQSCHLVYHYLVWCFRFTHLFSASVISDDNSIQGTGRGDSSHNKDGNNRELQASNQVDNDPTAADDNPTDLSVQVQLVCAPHMWICNDLSVHGYWCCCPIERKQPWMLWALAKELSIRNLVDLTSRFLLDQIYPDDLRDHSRIPLAACPRFEGHISTFNSTSSRFYAPSDLSGIGGM